MADDKEVRISIATHQHRGEDRNVYDRALTRGHGSADTHHVERHSHAWNDCNRPTRGSHTAAAAKTQSAPSRGVDRGLRHERRITAEPSSRSLTLFGMQPVIRLHPTIGLAANGRNFLGNQLSPCRRALMREAISVDQNNPTSCH